MKIVIATILIALFSFYAKASPFEHLNRENFDFDEEKRLKEQSVELESVLISKMIEPMFPDGKESGLYGGGHGSDIFRQMMIDEYARTLAKTNSLGLAKNIEKDLKR